MEALNVLIGLGALALGFFSGYIIHKSWTIRNANSKESKATKLLNEAKDKQKEMLLKARDKALEMVEEAKHEANELKQDLTQQRQRLEKRESLFDQKILDLENKQQSIQDETERINKIKQEILDVKKTQLEKLEKIAGLNQEEAKNILMQYVEETSKNELLGRIRKMQMESVTELEAKSRELLIGAMQRCAFSQFTEMTTTSVGLPSDEMKGRIIGKEGRNIKAIEQLTGVEIIIDETPGVATISCFSPIRRQLAKKALEALVSDGRIHPGRIEEEVEKAKKDLALEVKKAGEEAIYETGVAGLDPKLVHLLGRLKFRTSYGQNVLQHSIEVSHLSSLLATELGANVSIAKKAGLLHDIGKAVDHEVQGTHPELGKEIGKKFNLPEEIIIPIAHHHDDLPPTLEAVIVKVADALSGSRPGARKDSYEQYLQRLTDLEDLAKKFSGVEKAFAIQAGREIRVFVTPDEIDDYSAQKMAQNIARRIEEELQYPGEIKVTVIRDVRIIEYAR